MTTITTRSGKGSPLTNNEVDANFTNLNDDKVEASGDSMTGNLSFGDNNKAIFGASSDLQIQHTGTDSRIVDSGTGTFYIAGTDLVLLDGTLSERYADFTFGGASRLYYDNAVKLATTSTGIDVTGTVTSTSYGSQLATTLFEQNVLKSSVTASSGAFVRMAVSSASNPTYAFEDDTDTGVFTSGANTLNFGTAGTERLRIDSSGQVGIGTSNPDTSLHVTTPSGTKTELNLAQTAVTNYRLSIPASTDALTFVYGASTERMRIDASGRVGIGTSSPSSKVDIVGGDITGGLKISADKTTSAFFAFGADANETRITSTSYGGYKPLTIYTGGSERMRIDASGNVGISTTSPSSFNQVGADTLVVGSGSGEQGITIYSGTANNGVLAFADGTTTTQQYQGYIGYNHASNFMRFFTGATERMRIDSSGRLGLGTTSPSAELDIVGDATDAQIEVGNNLGQKLTITGGSSGIDFTTANALAMTFGTSGSERLRIDSSGEIGIGNAVASTINASSGIGNLVVGSGSDNEGITIYTGSSSYGALNFADATSGAGAYAGYIKFDHSDNSFGHFIDNVERVRIDSSGNVGIGTSAPSFGLSVESDNGSGYAALFRKSSSDPALTIQTTSSITQIQGLNSALSATNDIAMQVSGGNVGIGTASPSYLVDAQSSGDASIRIRSTGTGASDDSLLRMQIAGTTASNIIAFGDSDSSFAGEIRYTHNNNSMSFDTNGSEAMRINSSGNVGIGTASPAFSDGSGLRIERASTATLRLQDTGAHGFEIRATASAGEFFSANSKPFTFITGDSERLRIDSSGNVLVGKTAIGSTTDGFEARASGYTALSDTSGAALNVNRNSTDGNLVTFTKDGTTVGSIGSYLGAYAYIGSTGGTDTHIGFVNGTVRPATATGAGLDATLDLGNSSSRFKDLYLSNAAYLDKVIGHDDTNTYISFIGSDVTQFVQGGAEAMRISSSGTLLVNTTTTSFSPQMAVQKDSGGYVFESVRTGTGTEGHIVFVNGNGAVGTITSTGTSTAYGTSSDQRLKENIVDAPSASDDIDAIQVRSFDWKADGSHQKYGMVAQELQTVAPEAVTEGETEEDMMSVDYSKLVPMLVKEIQSLRARVAQLEGAN